MPLPRAFCLFIFLSSISLQSRWKSLTNTLSGLFCASLNFIDETLTTEPVLSFRLDEPLDLITLDKANTTVGEDSHLRYGYLPQENVCTENLTPWIKLLPCKAKVRAIIYHSISSLYLILLFCQSGIASLLNAHKIYNSNFHSMSIHAKSLCAVGDTGWIRHRILPLARMSGATVAS